MKSTTTLSNFLTAWQNHDADRMNHYTLKHMQGQLTIDRYNGWFEAVPKINFENIKEVANFGGIISDVQVTINGTMWQFRLMREAGKFKADEKKGRWRLNSGSMRKIQ